MSFKIISHQFRWNTNLVINPFCHKHVCTKFAEFHPSLEATRGPMPNPMQDEMPIESLISTEEAFFSDDALQPFPWTSRGWALIPKCLY